MGLVESVHNAGFVSSDCCFCVNDHFEECSMGRSVFLAARYTERRFILPDEIELRAQIAAASRSRV
jgi:hypothetical protein